MYNEHYHAKPARFTLYSHQNTVLTFVHTVGQRELRGHTGSRKATSILDACTPSKPRQMHPRPAPSSAAGHVANALRPDDLQAPNGPLCVPLTPHACTSRRRPRHTCRKAHIAARARARRNLAAAATPKHSRGWGTGAHCPRRAATHDQRHKSRPGPCPREAR